MPAPLTRLHAIALPMPRDNIDTDELIPVSENTRLSQVAGWGDALFASKRYLDGAGHTPDPSFILNQAPFDHARIIVAGANFGCGSSRETAVWALRDFGIRIVIAASFNETFRRNAVGNGLAPLAVDGAGLDQLQAAISKAPARGLTVDLPHGRVMIGRTEDGPGIPFLLDPYDCELLVSGRTEDEVLVGLQPDIVRRRNELELRAPWLRTVGPRV